MAAFNAGKYIDATIDSLIAQSFRDWELIAVNDCSTDDTLAILSRWASGDGRIKVFSNDTNIGLGATRRRAQGLACGEYGAVLDADDIALPAWLEELTSYLDSRSDVVLVSSSRILMDQNGVRMRRLHEAMEGPVVQWRLLFGNPINDPSCLFRLAAVRAAGGYAAHRYIQDWDLFSRLVKEGTIVQLDETLILYRVHAQSTSRTVGRSRAICEPVAEQIMTAGVLRAAGRQLPEGLAWYLTRSRPIFRGQLAESRRALEFLQDVCRQFAAANRAEVRRKPGYSSALAAAMLDDLANVLRTGCWSPATVLGSLRCVAECAGVASLLAPACLLRMVKLSSIPMTMRLLHSAD